MPEPALDDGLLRRRGAGEEAKVNFVELFFDLVFVFAITQLSHGLLAHPTALGTAQTALLLLAVWWVWIFTSWVTNWLDPQRAPVRLMLFVLMLAGLVLSTSLPEAFAERGLVVATAYVFMQVGRTVFTLWAMRGRSPANYRNFQRITAWFLLSAPFWIAGGLADEGLRFALWAAALAVEYVAPWLGFWTPGIGRSATTDWDVEGAHMAERCGLFIIIALGESVLVTGATFADMAWTSPAVAAFASAFVGSVAMWWIYFNIGAEVASRHIAATDDPGRVARLAYTYIHILLVAGIIGVAAADEFVLAHPLGHVDAKTAIAVLGGPAIFLIGNLLFKRAFAGRLPLSHLVGLALLFALALVLVAAPGSAGPTPLLFGAAATAVLVVVGVWETLSLRALAAELHGRTPEA